MPREGTCVSKGTKARKHEAHLEENNELLYEEITQVHGKNYPKALEGKVPSTH